MKFSCDRCGKKYATADNPAPGRVYKLKCKACGHLIVVKPGAEGPPPIPAPEIPLEVGAPEPAAPPPWPNEARSRSLDATTHVPMPAAEEPTPQPADGGYVDLFSDTGAAPLPGASPPQDPFFAAARASLPETYGTGGSAAPDPFAPLREVTPHETVTPEPPPMPKVPVIPKPAQQKSIVPIALMGGGVALLVGILAFVVLGSRGDAPPRDRSAPPAPAARAAQPPPVEPSPPITPPTPEPPPAQPAPDAAEARRAEAKRAADEERRAREERQAKEREEAAERAAQARADRAERDRLARDAKARAAADAKDRAREAAEAKASAAEAKARAAADAKERARVAAEAKARAAADAKERAREAAEAKARAAADAKERAREAAEAKARAAADARERERDDRVAAASEADQADSLTQSQIESVLRASKPSFDSCLRAAAGGDVKLDGRRIMLRLNIQPTGAVTYPTIDDVGVNNAELGGCLKGAARAMLFPKFSGDTMHVEVPLALSGR